jgi:monoamine oxidase
MPRTPLFDLVRRSLRLAHSTLHTGQEPVEAVQRWYEARAGRRAFLQASSAAAAGVALGACAARRPTPHLASAEPVVVVGAGIAGLTAAWRLHQAGVPVRVLEAQSRVGGRMLSLRGHFGDDQVVELGGELIDTGHEKLRALCQELGLALDDLANETPGLARDTWFFGGQQRSETEVVEAFLPLAARMEADLARLGEGDVTYRTPNGAEALDLTPLSAWLDRAGASGWIRALLEVAYATEYGLELDDQSTLNLLMMIDVKPEPFKVFGESDERFRVRGGNDSVPSALARGLGSRVETTSVLEAIGQAADGRLELTVRRGAASHVVPAAYVVLALPFTLLRDVRIDLELPPAKRKAIAELGYGTNAKLMVGFSDRVWRTRHRTNGSLMSDLAFQTMWETSRHQAGRAGVLTNFTGARHGVELGKGSAADQAAALVRDLEAVWPGVAASRAGQKEARFHWPSHPWTRGSYASYRVGQWTAICGAEGEAVGRLHFAGEHCSLSAQGFMEGGCETGEAAAAAILQQMGISKAALGAIRPAMWGETGQGRARVAS